MTEPRILENQAEWRAGEAADPASYTEVLTGDEVAQLDRALRHARATSDDLLEITRADFPLGGLAERLAQIENELINGRGFVVIRGIPREDYDNDEMCTLYWGIGMHLGKPWAQNKKGHLLGDVSDQGKGIKDPTARGGALRGTALRFPGGAPGRWATLLLDAGHHRVKRSPLHSLHPPLHPRITATPRDAAHHRTGGARHAAGRRDDDRSPIRGRDGLRGDHAVHKGARGLAFARARTRILAPGPEGTR